jgi:hypothetical protein
VLVRAVSGFLMIRSIKVKFEKRLKIAKDYMYKVWAVNSFKLKLKKKLKKFKPTTFQRIGYNNVHMSQAFAAMTDGIYR